MLHSGRGSTGKEQVDGAGLGPRALDVLELRKRYLGIDALTLHADAIPLSSKSRRQPAHRVVVEIKNFSDRLHWTNAISILRSPVLRTRLPCLRLFTLDGMNHTAYRVKEKSRTSNPIQIDDSVCALPNTAHPPM